MTAGSDNLLSSAEASARTCPIMVSSTYESVTFNDYTPPGERPRESARARSMQYARCLAGGCALWVWSTALPDRGYCGLRGKVVLP